MIKIIEKIFNDEIIIEKIIRDGKDIFINNYNDLRKALMNNDYVKLEIEDVYKNTKEQYFVKVEFEPNNRIGFYDLESCNENNLLLI